MSRVRVPRRLIGAYLHNILPRKDGCWQWLGVVTYTTWGYPRYNKTAMHRWAYAYFIGPIPNGADVMHTCDNPSCVNPLHLRVGTRRDNMRDANKKGRVRGFCSREEQS